MVAEWIAHVFTVWVVSWLNPGSLPLPHACRKHNRLPCWPSRGQQVSHQRWIWGIHCMQVTKHARRDPPWLWNPEQMSPEVQKRGISGPTKRTCVLQIFFLKIQDGMSFLPMLSRYNSFLRYAFLPDLADLIDLEVDFYCLQLFVLIIWWNPHNLQVLEILNDPYLQNLINTSPMIGTTKAIIG